MSRRFQIPFLPVFLTLLGVAFAVVLAARIRSYSGAAGGRADEGEVSSTISGPAATSRHASSTTADDVAVQTEQQTFTIVTVASKNGTAPALTPREQKYRELLNAPPPAAAPQPQPPVHMVSASKPPEKPQSTMQKIIDAIKSPFSSKPPAPTSSQQSSQSNLNHPPNADTPRDNKGPGDKQGQKDPTTDTTPPQVQAVQFDPPSIHDGEATMVIVTAVDDMSGIRGISGTVTSPTGKALQGFACQREAPTSNRYIGRVTIPRDAEDGIWHINFLNISDMASNGLTLTWMQSPVLQMAQLRVLSSRSDQTPPTVKNAWLDKRAMRAGEKNTLFVQAQDDMSGVNLVSGVFLSPKNLARIGVSCRGNSDNDIWACDFSMPVCLDCGDWQLEQIQLQDKASNMGAVTWKTSPIVAGVKVNIAGDSCDNTPPTLQSVMLSTNEVPSTPEGTQIDVRVAVVDEGGCGVASVSAQVLGPNGGNGQFFAFSPQGEPNWTGKMPIPRLAGKGVWKINWLQVMDKGNNLRVYYANDPLLSGAIVNVR